MTLEEISRMPDGRRTTGSKAGADHRRRAAAPGPTGHIRQPAKRTPGRGGVVLLHGIAKSPRTFMRMQMALADAGFATLNIGYPSRKKPLEELAEDVHPMICGFSTSLNGPLHFVGHSMGGLLIRVYIARHRPANLGRVVMLGTPNGGSEIADALKDIKLFQALYGPAGQQLATEGQPWKTALPPVDYEVGIIAGTRTTNPILSTLFMPRPNDGKVTVENTKLEGMADHVVIGKSHPFLTFHRPAIDLTLAFIDKGRFAEESAAPAP